MRIEDSKIIDKIGGTVVVAGLCDVSSQAVSRWRKNGIPRARMLYLKLIKPDAFTTELVNNKTKKSEAA